MGDPNLEGYNSYALLTSNAAPAELTDNGEYTFKAFAVDSAGNESTLGATYKLSLIHI